tara:strand:- start:917 stop:1228 length:312 start_codon:yes stop_codon:yes gene_type:complete
MKNIIIIAIAMVLLSCNKDKECKYELWSVEGRTTSVETFLSHEYMFWIQTEKKARKSKYKKERIEKWESSKYFKENEDVGWYKFRLVHSNGFMNCKILKENID